MSLRTADTFHMKRDSASWRSLKDRREILDYVQQACHISLLIKDTSQDQENSVLKAIAQASTFSTNPISGRGRGWEIIIY